MDWAQILNNNLNKLNNANLNEFKSLNSNYERVCFVLNKQVYPIYFRMFIRPRTKRKI